MTLQELLTQRQGEKEVRYEILLKHINNGVKIVDIDTTYIDESVLIGSGTTIYPCTYIHKDVSIGEGCSIGPFAYLRPGCVICDNVKIGDFVEVKNAVIGKNSKASHLAYIGDAQIGENVNFGCGAITVNYNGATKGQTIINDNAFIGSNSNLVAPVTVGKGGYIGAGSTVTKTVPENCLTIARARQENKEGRAPKF